MFAASYNYGGRPTQDKGETLCFLQQHIVGLGLGKSMSQKVQHFQQFVDSSYGFPAECSFIRFSELRRDDSVSQYRATEWPLKQDKKTTQPKLMILV